MNIEVVTDPGVNRGNDQWMTVGIGESKVADQGGVDDVAYESRVVTSAVGLAT